MGCVESIQRLGHDTEVVVAHHTTPGSLTCMDFTHHVVSWDVR